MDKASLRRRLLSARRALTSEDRARRGDRIRAAVLGLRIWEEARTLGGYLSLPDEVPTRELLNLAREQGKRIAAPVILEAEGRMEFRGFRDWSELRPGPLGILQPVSGTPVSPSELDLVLVPGVGFDLRGNRLGYGKGYFDGFLAGYAGWSLGLAFEMQIVERVPVGAHDRAVRQVLTELRSWVPE
jgi:5-formyltetrahydrofolate cyclo-ligase